jgi:hypothetical protein
MKNTRSKIILVACIVLLVFGSSAYSQDNEVNIIRNGRWLASSDGTTYIPVCWENAQGFSTEVQWVKSAIESTWESYANINFHGWGACSSNSRGIRILVKDNRSRSNVGRYMDGKYGGMELNFTFQNFSQNYCQDKRQHCIQAIAVHEFGHALGLAHEQDRADSLCRQDQDLTIGRYISLTPYDKDSVMNYCNRKWNNDGNLSYYDIQGIQAIYGRKGTSVTTTYYGSISVSDELGDDQIWEEVLISLGNSEKRFTINKSQPSNFAKWSFSDSGTYCFKFSTKALHADGNIYRGYGEKCYALTGGKNYSPLSLARDDWNSSGYYNIILK